MNTNVLLEKRDGPVCVLTLNRPEQRNAFNTDLIDALYDAFVRLHHDPDVRVVVVQGSGHSFCAGADAAWMRQGIGTSHDENLKSAYHLKKMFDAYVDLNIPTLAVVNGAAMGGGAGLVACSDIVVAQTQSVFGFPEVHLGLIPALISPYILARLGTTRTRRLFLTGEKFQASQAHQWGFVDELCDENPLEYALQHIVPALLTSPPFAQKEIKKLIKRQNQQDASLGDDLVAQLAYIRVQPEAVEGLTAFLEKRTPSWRGDAF